MTTATDTFEAAATESFRQRSSIADDVWHPRTGAAGSYEWWYFDAASDDGRDALVVIFLADFIFSPRYNAAVAASLRGRSPAPRPAEFPAVAVCLYRDGRPLIRAINEVSTDEFSASIEHPACRIGRSGFRLEAATGQPARAARYLINLDEPLRGGRRLEADFEWTVTEGDFSMPDEKHTNANDEGRASEDVEKRARWNESGHEWNMVAPRCRVAGTFAVSDRRGRESRSQVFNGTGYHDHNLDRRWMPATVAEWQWGRAHFADATAVFYRYRETGDRAPVTTRLFVVQHDALKTCAARFSADDFRRHHFGLRYPRRMRFDAYESDAMPGEVKRAGGASLQINQRRVIDSSYFYLRFVGDAVLDTGDGRARRAPAITEHLAPRALRWRWLDWLTSMRIGANGRTSFLP